jgi:hypothetical protein
VMEVQKISNTKYIFLYQVFVTELVSRISVPNTLKTCVSNLVFVTLNGNLERKNLNNFFFH